MGCRQRADQGIGSLGFFRKGGIGQQRGQARLVHRAIGANGAKRGEVDDDSALRGREERAAKGIARAANKGAAVAGETAHMGQGPTIDQNRRKSAGNHRAAATGITDPSSAIPLMMTSSEAVRMAVVLCPGSGQTWLSPKREEEIIWHLLRFE